MSPRHAACRSIFPEAESELVAGFHSEYSGMKFGMFFVGEYLGVILISAMITVLFFGGWHGPVLPPLVWFLIKTFLFIGFFILLRAGAPATTLRPAHVLGVEGDAAFDTRELVGYGRDRYGSSLAVKAGHRRANSGTVPAQGKGRRQGIYNAQHSKNTMGRFLARLSQARDYRVSRPEGLSRRHAGEDALSSPAILTVKSVAWLATSAPWSAR